MTEAWTDERLAEAIRNILDDVQEHPDEVSLGYASDRIIEFLQSDPSIGEYLRGGTGDRSERLRRTLESRSVNLMGPKSPFWRCEYCQSLAQSPLMFPHKPECLLAPPGDQP